MRGNQWYKFQSIRDKLLAAFSVFILFSCLLIAIFLWFEEQKSKIELVTDQLASINLKMSDASNLEKDFFIFEIINPNFYETGTSEYVIRHKSIMFQLKKDLENLQVSSIIKTLSLVDLSADLSKKITKSEAIFDSLVKLTQIKGFKDFGLEGKMRSAIHYIEKSKPSLNIETILTLRRHEKDYIIRKEPEYIEKLQKSVTLLRKQIQNTFANQDSLQLRIAYLETYEKAFLEMVSIEEQIGLQNKSGLKKRFIVASDEIEKEIEAIDKKVFDYSAQLSRQLRILLFTIFAIFLLLNIGLAYFVILKLGKPINQLSSSINEVIESNFALDHQIIKIEKNDEVGRLSKDFIYMLNRVRERTAEIEQQKEEIETQKDQLEQSYDNLKLLNEIGQKITVNLSIQKILETVYASIDQLIGTDVFAIGLHNPHHNRLDFYNEKGRHDGSQNSYHDLEDENSLPVHTFKLQREIFINNLQEEYNQYINDLSLTVSDGYRNSLLYLPLSLNDKRLGIITIQSISENAYSEYQLNILRNLAIFTSIALDNTKVYEEMTEKNQKIIESINYAQRIQEAMLPKLEEIQATLPESFILWRPRDIVSGDFYWYAKIEPRAVYKEVNTFQGTERVLKGFENEKIILAALDATGHGVPGAFMSMVGIDLLNKIVLEENISEPDLILDQLHKGINQALKQEETQNKDGMDVALCVIDLDDEIIEFSGAYNPLIVIQNDEMKVYKADKNPIGGWYFGGKRRSFTKQTIAIKHPTTFYIFSDGYADQVGSIHKKKFMIKHFRDLLMEIYKFPMEEQRQILNSRIIEYMGDEKQIDDILVIGVRIE